jgi:hypothetical protein
MPSAEAAGTSIGRSRWRYPRRRRSNQQAHSRTLRASPQNRLRGVARQPPAGGSCAFAWIIAGDLRDQGPPRLRPQFAEEKGFRNVGPLSQIRSLFFAERSGQKKSTGVASNVGSILAEPMVRIRPPPAVSRANHRFLSGGTHVARSRTPGGRSRCGSIAPTRLRRRNLMHG